METTVKNRKMTYIYVILFMYIMSVYKHKHKQMNSFFGNLEQSRNQF